MDNKLIIYHTSCWDGFCAAWLCHHVWPDAEYIAANYGWKPPDVTGKNVLIVDFSYQRQILLDMYGRAEGIIVLDHHDTAQQELSGLSFCRFDVSKSGARLTWDYLVECELLPRRLTHWLLWQQQPHWLVRYTEDRDLWKHELPYSKQINAAIRSYPLDFGVWNYLSRQKPKSFIKEGIAILRYKQDVIDHHLRYAHGVRIGDLVGKGICCSTAHIWSEIADQLLSLEPVPFVVIWVDTNDGQRLYSIRTPATGPNAGEIARQFGGGGHTHAAGFKIPISHNMPDGHPQHFNLNP